jgi:hypothetical protein
LRQKDKETGDKEVKRQRDLRQRDLRGFWQWGDVLFLEDTREGFGWSRDFGFKWFEASNAVSATKAQGTQRGESLELLFPLGYFGQTVPLFSE